MSFWVFNTEFLSEPEIAKSVRKVELKKLKILENLVFLGFWSIFGPENIYMN